MTRAEKVCWTLTVLGATAVLAPFLLEETMQPLGEWRWVGVMVGTLVGLTAFICVFLFRARGRVQEELAAGRNLYAHWTYQPDEWGRFAAEDVVRERREKWQMFAIVAFFSVLFGVAFPIFDPEAGWAVTAAMVGMLAIIAVVIQATTAARLRRRRREVGELRVGRDGLLLAGELHIWRGWGACLEEVTVIDGTPPCLAFTYSTPAKNGRQYTTVRAPIPVGHDLEAAVLAAKLAEQSRKTR